MTLVTVGPGTATITMPVREDMANGHGIAHGGYIFTLADSAFAFACNSYNKSVVAQPQLNYLPGTGPDWRNPDRHRAGSRPDRALR